MVGGTINNTYYKVAPETKIQSVTARNTKNVNAENYAMYPFPIYNIAYISSRGNSGQKSVPTAKKRGRTKHKTVFSTIELHVDGDTLKIL